MNEVIERAKENTVRCKERLLKTFSFVADDKLTWTPSDTAHSALRIVAHCAVANYGFARFLRGKESKADSLSDALAMMASKEKEIATRAQAVQAFEASAAAVLEALDAMTVELMTSEVRGPFGPMPMTFWVALPGRHMDNHAAQIDYLQTCWGDLEFHM